MSHRTSHGDYYSEQNEADEDHNLEGDMLYGKAGDLVSIAKLEQCFNSSSINVEVINQVLKLDCTYDVRSANHVIE